MLPLHFIIVDDHPVVTGDDDTMFGPTPAGCISPAARGFWDWAGLGEATHAVLVTNRNKIVAFFRYYLEERELNAAGTWVEPSWRRQGIATRMWKLALETHGPSRVDAIEASDDGHAFLQAVRLNLVKNINISGHGAKS